MSTKPPGSPALRVTGLWRYPVKSMGGEPLLEAEVTDVGLAGDRAWGLVDPATGKVLTARREPRLLFASARLIADDQVEIRSPEGCLLRDDAELSGWLGRPVSLQRAGASGGTYEMPTDFETEAEWFSWQGPARAWHDLAAARVSLISTASLGSTDVRRIRPNVLLDGYGEDGLVGRTARLGTSTLSVATRINRCVMVTRPQPGLDKDLEVLRTIKRELQMLLAVGATVAETGWVAIGDELGVTAPGRR